jgi:NAD-dependent SIR2 family protein deacetylase
VDAPVAVAPDTGVRHALRDLLELGDVMALTGAGISTESGIPDYRGPTGALRKSLPMTYQTFVRDADARQRYWARSQLGWRFFREAVPNDGHRAVAQLQSRGLLAGVVTQNVDGLHQAAGAVDVVELHGNLETVVCLSCRVMTARAALDERLRLANPTWSAVASTVNPDGDVTLPDEVVRSFQVVDCLDCGGLLKPDVVYFGENVPPPKVAHCYDLVARSKALLVLGSSLSVMSGLRFVKRAAALGKPVAIVNQGWTRGDDYATVKLDAPLGQTLTALC